jgi:PAS domain S-box-containing protein
MNGRRKRILIVDDEKRNRNLLQAIVKVLDHEWEEAQDGRQALSKMGQEIDLVLLDVMMPGMDGFEVVRRIRQNPVYGDVPIIMVTVLTKKSDRLRAVEAGANDFINKPVDPVEFRIRVDALLKLKAAQDEIKRHRLELEQTIERRTQSLCELLETSASIVQTMPSGLLVFQHQPPCELFLTNINPEAERITGMTVTQWRGQELDEVWPEARRQGITQALFRVMETGEVFQSEQAFFVREDTKRILKVRGFRIPGSLLGLALEDITERHNAQRALSAAHEDLERRVQEQTAALSEANEQPKAEIAARKLAEDKLVQAGRLRAIKEMAGGVSRSFTNFFHAVTACAQKTKEVLKSGRPEDAGPLQNQILEAARQGMHMAHKLEGIGASQTDPDAFGRKEVFDLADAAQRAAEMIGRRIENVTCQTGSHVSLAAELVERCFIEGERTSVFELIVSLLKNAVEACVEGGEVTITTSVEDGKAVLRVRDDGVGIPQQDLGKIFEPFWTTKDGQSGLGLAVSLAVVQRHDGTIRVASNPGKGSQFTVQLQLVDKPVSA